MEKKMIIDGMKCNHCRMTVEKALMGVEGVIKAEADLESRTAVITLERYVDDQVLMNAVAAKDFTPVKML